MNILEQIKNEVIFLEPLYKLDNYAYSLTILSEFIKIIGDKILDYININNITDEESICDTWYDMTKEFAIVLDKIMLDRVSELYNGSYSVIENYKSNGMVIFAEIQLENYGYYDLEEVWKFGNEPFYDFLRTIINNVYVR